LITAAYTNCEWDRHVHHLKKETFQQAVLLMPLANSSFWVFYLLPYTIILRLLNTSVC